MKSVSKDQKKKKKYTCCFSAITDWEVGSHHLLPTTFLTARRSLLDAVIEVCAVMLIEANCFM